MWWVKTMNWEQHPESKIKHSKFDRNRYGYITRSQNDFTVICYHYVKYICRLYHIENRCYLRIWIWVTGIPRVDQLTKWMQNFERAVYKITRRLNDQRRKFDVNSIMVKTTKLVCDITGLFYSLLVIIAYVILISARQVGKSSVFSTLFSWSVSVWYTILGVSKWWQIQFELSKHWLEALKSSPDWLTNSPWQWSITHSTSWWLTNDSSTW